MPHCLSLYVLHNPNSAQYGRKLGRGSLPGGLAGDLRPPRRVGELMDATPADYLLLPAEVSSRRRQTK